MDFNNNKPIYRQIADYCCRRIVDGGWEPDGRVPSVKELSVEMAVNSRTVLKAYEELQDAGIIYQKRGLGYYVAAEAVTLIRDLRRSEFFSETIPELRRHMELLGLSLDDIAPYLK